MSHDPSEKLQDTLAYPPRLLRADRAAAYLGMGERTFRRLVAEGQLQKREAESPVLLRGTAIGLTLTSTTPMTLAENTVDRLLRRIQWF